MQDACRVVVDRLRITDRGPVWRILIAVCGIALVVLAAVLIVRPLTALIGVVITIAAALVLAAVKLVSGRPRQPWRWIWGVLLAGAAPVLLLVLPSVVRALPGAVAISLVVNAARLALRAMRTGPLGLRLALAAYSISNLLVAYLVVAWPDLAAVVLGAGFAAAIGGIGVVAVLNAIRPHPSRPQSRRPASAMRRLAGGVVALAIAIAATTGSIVLATGTVQVDDFYTWRADIPATPGQVLRVADYSGELPTGAAAVRILYATTYSNGSPALASAVVAYPTAPADEPRPVLAWQHGTTGVARSCAPSAGPEALTEYAIPGISRAMERGWVVVATDYPGQGTPGRYPYLIGEGEGRATLDAIRAAQQIEDAHASLDAWIWGHSQGGHASLWAGQIAADYAPEITIIGVAALSAASDPLMLAERVTGGQSTALTKIVISLVLVPYADEYPDVSLASAVHPAGQGIVEAFAGRCLIERPTLVSVLVASTLTWDAPLYRINLANGPMHDRLSQNIADGIVAAPVFLGQGVDDEVIPITMQRGLDEKLCAAGRAVETHEYPGRSHMGVIAAGSPLVDDLFAWADAVAPGAEPSNCGS